MALRLREEMVGRRGDDGEYFRVLSLSRVGRASRRRKEMALEHGCTKSKNKYRL